MNNKLKKYSGLSDTLILIFLTIQIAFVSISIAVSSIAFGIWLGIFLIQIITKSTSGIPELLQGELKYFNIFVLLYIFFEILSRFFALYPDGAFSNLKRLLLFLIFYISVIKIKDFDTLKKILFINISVVSVISIVELIRYAMLFGGMVNEMPFSEIRIDYFNYPLTAGEIKMLSFLSVFPMIFIKENFPVSRKYLMLILLPVFISMILTQSRNVFLAMFVCFVVYGITVNRKFLAAFLVVIILSWLILPAGLTKRFSSMTDLKHSSNSSRISMWETGLKMFADHPFTGVADSHILEIYSTYKTPDTPGEGVHLHNNFIMILATTGIFGFISFTGIFLTVFLRQIKYYREIKDNTGKMLILGSILAMISFQISGFFEWSFGDHEVMTVFFFLMAVPFVIKNTAGKAKV